MARRIKLGFNVDHVATVRQARRIDQPDPVAAALLAELAGADGITVHLREDRRHIQDRDVRVLKQVVKTRLNLEMGLADEIQKIALDVVPYGVTLVPEKRQEITTEGGLDAIAESSRIAPFTKQCRDKGIDVSLFIDPEALQVRKAKELGATAVEMHTGTYCEYHRDPARRAKELTRLKVCVELAKELGLEPRVGHGLDYVNVEDLVRNVSGIAEANIGHSIVARAVFVGIEQAIREMRELLVYG
ncbi:MAG: pyridoxine 5'-phosphate synthase [Planctomycetaceae bacterium]|nr:pyridoxine 5'-phosphate synthase [Planctomycetaceae bacterium]